MVQEYLGNLEAEIVVFDPADSREITQKDAEKLFGRGVKTIRDDETGFPEALKNLGIREVHSLGELNHRMASDIAIALSSKPSEREASAAMSCIDELAKPGATFAFVIGSAIATKLASAILAKGANVSGWVPQGLLRYHLPAALQKALANGNLALFSLAKTEQGWNPRLASQSTMATLSSSRANLVTDPEPNWIKELIRVDFQSVSSSIFYIYYQSTSPSMLARWTAIAAHPIKRRSTDGRPNLTPILDRLHSSVSA